MDPSLLNKSDCFILDLGKGHDILVYMPKGARRMEKFKATQAANEIRDEDHAGDANVEIIGGLNSLLLLTLNVLDFFSSHYFCRQLVLC